MTIWQFGCIWDWILFTIVFISHNIFNSYGAGLSVKIKLWFSELGQLREFGAISAGMAKSTQQKLSEQQAAAQGSSVADSNPKSPEAEQINKKTW